MKNLISVFALTARSTLYKCIGMIAAAAALEAGFLFRHQQTLAPSLRLESILDQPVYRIIICITGIILLWTLAAVYRGKGKNKPAYTLIRLTADEKTLIIAAALYNFCMLLFAAAVQILIFWIYCKVYAAQAASVDAKYMTYLAFTRSDLVSTILPMGNLGILPCYLVILAAVCLSAAYSGIGRSPFPLAAVLFPVALQLFSSDGYGYGLLASSFVVSTIVLIILVVLMRSLDPMLEQEVPDTGGEQDA